MLVALPVTMVLDPAATAASVERQNPSLPPSEVQSWASAAVAYAAAIHLVYAVLVTWLGAMTLRRRRWARVALTIALVLATLGSLDSATRGPGYLWWAIAGDVLHVAIIAMLWVPGSVRQFFAVATRRGVRTG
ncbi:hypothetical protein EV378_2586 [Pseudonocardia endophytica]|uniref:Uncharacterized protein n=1 Tax=Pseudonocardia endophytica TaxID=401976 RepID=A0A4R1HYW2_PSEEN|nr:hypothetical protein EV378_2586 [Pseudonocardia endophytica]